MRDHAVLLDGVTRTYGKGTTEVVAFGQVGAGFAAAVSRPWWPRRDRGRARCRSARRDWAGPDSGAVRIAGQDITRLGAKGLAVLRRDRIGVIFQAFNLVPSLTTWQNVILPSRLARRRPGPSRVRELLHRAGREGHRPAQLSSGRQQRVAIARALPGRPEALLGFAASFAAVLLAVMSGGGSGLVVAGAGSHSTPTWSV
ncbi:ATP-binding cassette domain-containing protein [Nonomuraea bangladeshensis]|uniref:ATP-binding cassette domain-containing protein n=1 Tax=Nonomuraea bangladeshensis TaxID=404385 RepID=UPI003C2DA479